MSENSMNSTEEIVLTVEMSDSISAQAAEAWAVGQRGGVDVAETDPTWHNNAKYYAEQAEEAAGEAQAAEEAAQRAEAAQAAAEAARDRAEAIGAGAVQSATAAAESAQAAATAKAGAETAQGAAAGSAAAAEGSAGRASQSATAAAGSATAAGTAKTAAETARDSATGSATAAAGSATAAGQSAQAAAASAQAAENVAESIPADYSQLSDDVSGLKSAFEQLDANVITESAGPSPIVSIADGADGMPMRKVEVAIEPVQDLHGYDYPWPAGGGKNLLKVTASTNTVNGVTLTVNEDGTISCSGNATDTAIFNVCRWAGTSGTEYVLSGCPSGGGDGSTYKLDYNNSPYVVDKGSGIPFTASGNEGLVRIVIYAGNGDGLVFKPMIRLATETDATFAPYSNICPISGWTGAKVTRTGKNLFDEVYTGIRAGSVVTYKPVFVGSGIFTLSSTTPYSGSGSSLFLLSGNVSTGASTGTNGVYADRPITMPSVDGYVTIGYRNYQDINPSEYKTQLEVGSTVSDYEPYLGNTYEVTFPADPGTVYGGTLDAVTGKLVVDRAVKDMGSATWKYNPSSGLFYYTQSDIKTGVPVADKLDLLICSCYATADNPGSGRVPVGMIGTGSAGGRSNTSIIVNDSRYDDPDAFKDAVTGQTICYKLANPTEITLTPTEIKTLLSTNNIWSDAGNTSITYPADTKIYIDNRINSTRKLIAGIETGFTASKAYAVGDMLIIGDDLYKVASSIASGATITVGTNVTKTTVAEQLLALANA